jgi:YfiH family protein
MMQSWEWKSQGDHSYLTCQLLEPWPHGFFTRHFYPDSPETLVKHLDPVASVHRVKQVHGNTVLNPAELRSRPPSHPVTLDAVAALHEADGILSDEHQQSLWVCSADCVPVLIGDIETGHVAAVHAGWRGTAARIVPMAIARLQTQGSHLKNLRIAMGPAIAGEVYQVSKTVAAELSTSLSPLPVVNNCNRQPNPDDTLQALRERQPSPLYPDDHPERVKIDVRGINYLQLEQLGILVSQIAIAPHCTYQQPDNFFSYRRTSQKQVQWSGIVSQMKAIA